MITLSELLRMPELGLTLRAGGAGHDVGIAWAHVSELADPTEWLEGGELLLLTGSALSPDPDGQRAYLARLADAGVAAVGLGVGLSWAEVPPALLAAADDLRLPLVEVPRATPFLAISKAVSRAAARRELAAKEHLLHAQRKLTAAALGGLGALLDETVRLTGGWGALLGATGAVLAASPPNAGSRAAAADLARLRDAPGPASVSTHDGTGEQWLQSLLGRGGVLGFLVVGHDIAFDPAQRQVVNAAVPLFTLSLDRSQLLVQGRRGLESSVLRLVLDGRPEIVAAVAADLWHGLPAAPLVVALCMGTRHAVGVAQDRLHAERGLPVLHGSHDGELVCVAAERDAAALVAGLQGIDGLRIGLSDPAGYDGLQQARAAAARAAEHAVAGPGTQAVWFRDLPRPGLYDLVTGPDAAEFSSAALRPLLELPHSAELMRSLRVWLAHHGQWHPAAADLGVHRHTLRNRLRTVERALGRPLDSPDQRAELWLALRLHGPN